MARHSAKAFGESSDGSHVVCTLSLVDGWTANSFDTLNEADFAFIADSGVEIALLGTGDSLRFPPQALMRPLAERQIGLDVMDTQAACRTYNILIVEGRKVGAFLLLPGKPA